MNAHKQKYEQKKEMSVEHGSEREIGYHYEFLHILISFLSFVSVIIIHCVNDINWGLGTDGQAYLYFLVIIPSLILSIFSVGSALITGEAGRGGRQQEYTN